MSERSVGRTVVKRVGAGGLCVFMLAATGCQMYANPYVDPYSETGPVTTPSSIRAFEVKKEPRATERAFAAMAVAPTDESVTHGPLYFEDRLGDASENDGRFAWTGADFLSVLTWRARYLLNLGLFPISVVDTPPWCVMSSDGRASRRVLWTDHDAKKVGAAACCSHKHIGSL